MLAGFTAGNIVVYRVGTAGGPVLQSVPNRANPVFLDEFDPASHSLVQSHALPTEASGDHHGLTATAFDQEGALTRSADGQYLVLTGYDAPLGTSPLTSKTTAEVPRVIGRVDAEGVIDTSTIITDAFSTKEIRSAASVDGSQFWAVGSDHGVRLVEFGSGGNNVEISSTPTNLRAVNVFGGQLFVTTTTNTPATQRIGMVGSGTPTTGGQTYVPLSPLPSDFNPYQFFAADLSESVPGVDTLYVAEALILRKYRLVGSSWEVVASIPAPTGLRGITGEVVDGTVTLYATTAQAENNRLVKAVDASGYGGVIGGNFQQIAVAGARRVFRGVAMAPVAAPAEPQEPEGEPHAVVVADDGDNAIELRVEDGNMIVMLDGNEALNQPLASLLSLAINGGAGNDTVRLDETLNQFGGSLVIVGGAGSDTLLTDAGAFSASDAQTPQAHLIVTESTLAGMENGAPVGPSVAYGQFEALRVQGTSGDDTFAIALDASDLVTVTVDGAAGDDPFLLDLNTDPVDVTGAVPGLESVTLIGGPGADSFGQRPGNAPLPPPPDGLAAPVLPAGRRQIEPSTTTAIVVWGDEPSAVAGVGNRAEGNGAGNQLHLDLSPSTADPLAIALVSTLGGQTETTGYRPVTFGQIAGLQLTDQGLLTRVEMGDLYVRGTQAGDLIQFSLAGAAGFARVRIGNLIVDRAAAGRVVAYGRGGNDTLVNANLPGGVEFHGEAGDDYLAGGAGNDLLVGGAGHDRVLGAGGANELWGDELGQQDLPEGGNDYVVGGAGDDVLYGGGGNDQLYSGGGHDYVSGGHGNDAISGGPGDDRLYGGPGVDTISGDEGDDLLVGGEGDDGLYGRTGNDVLIGGLGADFMMGEAGNDLLLGGRVGVQGHDSDSTRFGDAADLALRQLLADWTLAFQISQLLSTQDDHQKDTLSGGLGHDTVAAGESDTGDWDEAL